MAPVTLSDVENMAYKAANVVGERVEKAIGDKIDTLIENMDLKVAAAVRDHAANCDAPRVIERLKGAVTVWQIVAGLVAIIGTAATVYAVVRNVPCK